MYKCRHGLVLPHVSGEFGWRDQHAYTKSNRRYPSRAVIRAYWAPLLSRRPWRKFDCEAECLEQDYCFACGMLWGPRTDRAHILARVYGGSDEPRNLHLLCRLCHEMSEGFEGLAYWRWFKRQRGVDAAIWGASRTVWRLFGERETFRMELGQVFELAYQHLRHVKRLR